MKTILVVDDLRSIEPFNRLHQNDTVVLARTYDEAIQKLTNLQVDHLYLDHDLGCIDDDGKELTGYSVLCYIRDELSYLPGEIILITSNPVGRKNMQALIDNDLKEK